MENKQRQKTLLERVLYIRLKIGRYAGEIKDVISEAARQMLADGRAEDPYAPGPDLDCAPAHTILRPAETAKRGKRRS